MNWNILIHFIYGLPLVIIYSHLKILVLNTVLTKTLSQTNSEVTRNAYNLDRVATVHSQGNTRGIPGFSGPRRSISAHSHCSPAPKIAAFRISEQTLSNSKWMPFGVSSALMVLIGLAAHLRLQGIHIYPYLDNLLIRSPSLQQAQHDLRQVRFPL